MKNYFVNPVTSMNFGILNIKGTHS